jgi:hypothetical protein
VTSDIVEFVKARLDEDEQIADLISSGGYQPQHWRLTDDKFDAPDLAVEIDGDRLVEVRALDGIIGGELDEDSGVVAYVRDGRNEHLHIVRHDPARVLREVESNRELLLYCASELADDETVEWPALLLAKLAAVWSDHPDYRTEWQSQP